MFVRCSLSLSLRVNVSVCASVVITAGWHDVNPPAVQLEFKAYRYQLMLMCLIESHREFFSNDIDTPMQCQAATIKTNANVTIDTENT